MVNYSIRQSEMDSVFSALSDPTRRAILRRLARGEATVSELAAPHEMSLPAISKHLSVLESAALLSKKKRGRIVHCRLRTAALRRASDWLSYYERFWTEQLESLESFLQENDDEELR